MTRRCVTDEQYGNLWRRATEFVRRVDEGTIPFEDAMTGLQNLVERLFKTVYSIMVDYSQSLAKMVKAGNYDWVNSDINSKHFPLKGKGKHKLEAVLFHFNRSIESDEAIAEMNKQDYHPATIEELLALGKKYPDLQKEFPIIALGSVWRGPGGGRSVPCLDRGGSERFLSLGWFGYGWDAHDRFLAVRK